MRKRGFAVRLPGAQILCPARDGAKQRHASPEAADPGEPRTSQGNDRRPGGLSDFAERRLGASRTQAAFGSETTGATLDFTIDLASVPAPENLLMGFFDALPEGNGFSTMTFSISVDFMLVEYQSWTNPNDAAVFFGDQFIDYGPMSSLDRDGDGLVHMSFQFSVTPQEAGDGFFGSILVGDPPPAIPVLPEVPHDLLLV